MKRKICVVTGSRADYGLLYWIIKGINNDPRLQLQLVVTGTHLLPKFGMTVKEIEKDGFRIAAKVKLPLLSDKEASIAKAIGAGIIGFAGVYNRLKPDILLVLGDRFEIFSAVAASTPFRIPVAHIHGGEATEGVIDESMRHAITKMSHLHFTSTPAYTKKVIQMGESPRNVFCFGAPGLDSIRRLNLMHRVDLCQQLQLPHRRKIGMVTYHPVTLEKNTVRNQISELLKAIDEFKDIYWVFTFPNIDRGSLAIIKKIKEFIAQHHKQGKVFVSLGQLKYLSLLKNASAMLGNSSSGLIEAPAFELPVVNIGDRQRGRVRARNVIDVAECKKEAISRALRRALSPAFRNYLRGMKNPYSRGVASEKIIAVLKRIPLNETLIKKKFYEFHK